MALRGSASADPIGDVQRHLSVYSKQIADTLYYAKEMKREDDVRIAALAADLVGASKQLDKLIGELPDYPRDKREVESQLAAILEARNQAIPSLKLALQEAEAARTTEVSRFVSAVSSSVLTPGK